jgi:hypothetical protein
VGWHYVPTDYLQFRAFFKKLKWQYTHATSIMFSCLHLFIQEAKVVKVRHCIVFIHRKKFHVILLHNSSASEALILCASEHYNFATLVEDLPLRGTIKVLMMQLACEDCQ